MFSVSSNFIGNFKLGDNINFNLAILALLYSHFDRANPTEQRLLCKPIIVLLVSIIEALLHDFHDRAKSFTIEGVKNLTTDVLLYVRGKKLDELEKYIASARKHDFFDAKDTRFYERLDDLRKLRNRIHIQNTKKHFEADDINAFTEARKVLAERVLEKVLKVMAVKFPRAASFTHVADFQLPWAEHLPSID